MRNFTFTTSKSIIVEVGAAKRIAEICREQGIYNPLIVTDPGIEKAGVLDVLCDCLRAEKMTFATFAKVVADPPEVVVKEALALAASERVDGVIGLGGGSSLDTAKLVALLAKSGESLQAIYGVEQARGPRLPLVLIPTTAGTGSEVTAVAIVTTGATSKMGVVSKFLYPDVAILDAELTLGLPPAITAMTGVDAMVHAVEAYTSVRQKNPYSDLLAGEALRLMSTHILNATRDGSNLEARQGMMLGACLAGQAFANAPVAAVHALAYPLGGHYHIPHGLSNSLILPQVLAFNAPAAEELYAELAEFVIPPLSLDLGKPSSTSERCQQFIDYFVSLIKSLALPSRLSEMDIPEKDLPILAEDAMKQQRLLVNNPRPVTAADALAIYRAAY
ncbi:iron-containing alcohol dehydrogenase [Zhongshania aquimaris]|uniref:Iron-containing alcohol dehydrogenase n=1 Tax=Zhongshania aquimaris TaxID=2857107 RepID=A0ABS6VNV8_9GAMM|nr:iron-containing alcohol dehydrogenase [Zhongshania aquimaris]MBW2939997.1 iron-containing alcohol dehydrogenase [Zhongshania aquimaris]